MTDRANTATVDAALALARLRDWARTMIELHGRSQVTDDILAVRDERDRKVAVHGCFTNGERAHARMRANQDRAAVGVVTPPRP